MPDQPAAVAARAGRRVAVRPAEALGALAQAGDEVAAAERHAGLGVDLGLVAHAQLDRVDAAAARRARPSPTPARTCPGTRPARASRTASARRAGASRWRGAAVGRRVHHARGQRGLLGELRDASRSARRPRGRSPSAGRRRRRRAGPAGSSACGSRRAANICWRVRATLDRPARRPCAAMRGEHDVRARRALGAEAAADVLGDHPHLLGRRGRTTCASVVARRARALGGVVRASAPPPSHARDRRVRLHRVVVLGGRACRSRRRRPRPRRSAGLDVALLGVGREAGLTSSGV